MPIKLNVGLSKKIGQPDYGSLGASCHLEIELDSSLLEHDLESFHKKVRNAYVACRQAVGDELARYDRPCGNTTTRASHQSPHRNQSSSHTRRDGNGRGQSISQKQLNYVRHLGSEIESLGASGASALAERMFDKPLTELTSFEGSALIDSLKSIKSGQLSLDDVFGQGAAI